MTEQVVAGQLHSFLKDVNYLDLSYLALSLDIGLKQPWLCRWMAYIKREMVEFQSIDPAGSLNDY